MPEQLQSDKIDGWSWDFVTNIGLLLMSGGGGGGGGGGG
jgi:hypothetical protein